MNKTRLEWIGLALVLLLCCGAHVQAQSENGTPAIDVPEAQFEFESVVEGTSVTHGFVVRNSGDVPLVIERVRTG
jgi:hypothetical protein